MRQGQTVTDMNLDIRDIAYLIATGLSLGAMVYSWLTARSKANASAIDDITVALGKHNERIIRLEGAGQQLQTDVPEMRREIGRVHERVDDVARTVASLDGQMAGITRNVDLITQHLLRDGDGS